jgi:hypothetical protein
MKMYLAKLWILTLSVFALNHLAAASDFAGSDFPSSGVRTVIVNSEVQKITECSLRDQGLQIGTVKIIGYYAVDVTIKTLKFGIHWQSKNTFYDSTVSNTNEIIFPEEKKEQHTYKFTKWSDCMRFVEELKIIQALSIGAPQIEGQEDFMTQENL